VQELGGILAEGEAGTGYGAAVVVDDGAEDGSAFAFLGSSTLSIWKRGGTGAFRAGLRYVPGGWRWRQHPAHLGDRGGQFLHVRGGGCRQRSKSEPSVLGAGDEQPVGHDAVQVGVPLRALRALGVSYGLSTGREGIGFSRAGNRNARSAWLFRNVFVQDFKLAGAVLS
jgi:hypothetical protein